MKYSNVVQGKFVRRLNRFVAEVEIGGAIEQVHVKNTGRLRELLVPGAEVCLEKSRNAARKYRHSLIAVRRGGIYTNIDSQAPNAVVFEALQSGKVQELGAVERLKREVVYGGSRFDLAYERNGREGLMEVKGVTLVKEDTAMFPDAPTQRGTKHVLELIDAVENGYEGVMFFLVQTKGCRRFAPHADMDRAFAEALEEAARRGVLLLAYDAKVTESSIAIGEPLAVTIR